MSTPSIIGPGFFLWVQTLLIWSVFSYGVSADPLPGEPMRVSRKKHWLVVTVRFLVAATLTYLIAESFALSGLVLAVVLFQAVVRPYLSIRWVAEFELMCWLSFTVFSWWLIDHCHFSPSWTPSFMPPSHMGALCICGTVLLMVVRGDTYLVRGVLGKAGSLPTKKKIDSVQRKPTKADLGVTDTSEVALAASAEESPVSISRNTIAVG